MDHSAGEAREPGPVLGARWRGRSGAVSRMPLGLVGFIGIILAVESLFCRLDYALLSGFQYEWKLTSKISSESEADADVLCFGDSQLKLGIVPQVLERRLDMSVYNLSLIGGRTWTSYFLFRRILEAGHRPGAVVVDFFPFFMKQGYQLSLPLLPEVMTPSDCLDLADTSHNPALLGHLLAAKLLPSLLMREGFRDQVVSFLGGQVDPPKYSLAQMVRNWRANQGSMLMPCAAGLWYNVQDWRRKYFPDTNFNPVNLIYLDRFLSIAEEYQIPVYWVLPPCAPALRAECESSGYDASLTQFAQTVQKKHPGVVVLDARGSGIGANLFNDPHHLGSEGAYALSTALGEAIVSAPHASSDRWVTLPRYQARPVDWPLEDLDDSKAIVMSQGRSIRR